jgi:uncharacterized SAM-binding protein YcdF (DUF218 family)
MNDVPTAQSSTQGSGERAPVAAARAPGRVIGRIVLILFLGSILALALGFYGFVQNLPTEEIKLKRNADAIVALTGGASRVIDALELLAAGHGQRLLISGANPSTNAKEISRLHPEYASIVRCCVDFDRSINTLGNAIETRKWAVQRKLRSLIVVTSGYHMPRALAEIRHQLPEVTLIAFPVISEQARTEPWWPEGARRVGLEYFKFVAAHIRMRLNPDAGETHAGRRRAGTATPLHQTGGWPVTIVPL